MACLLRELCFYAGIDSTSKPKEACCAVVEAGCCCLCVGRCCSAQRSAGRAIAARAPGVTLLGSHSSAANSVAGRAFAGTPRTDPDFATHWNLGPRLADLSDPSRAAVATFWMSFNVQRWADAGAVLAVRHEGSIGAVMGVGRVRGAHDWGRKTWLQSAGECAVVCRFVCSGQMPSIYTDKTLSGVGDAVKRRTDGPGGLLDTFTKMHTQHTAGMAAHWYVALMAVDPSMQGQRLCSRLMRALCEQADAEGLPVYLETSGTRNTTVYARFGFAVVGTHRMAVEGDEDGSGPFEQCYAMVRPAAAAAAAPSAQTISRVEPDGMAV